MGAVDHGQRAGRADRGLIALLVTHTNFSVSTGVGFLALFAVCVQTGVIMLEYINQMRALGPSVVESAVEGAVLRLRPILMTSLVATSDCCLPFCRTESDPIPAVRHRHRRRATGCAADEHFPSTDPLRLDRPRSRSAA